MKLYPLVFILFLVISACDDHKSIVLENSKDKMFPLKEDVTQANSDAEQSDSQWKISQKEAKRIVLNKYPNILDKARIVGPMRAKVTK